MLLSKSTRLRKVSRKAGKVHYSLILSSVAVRHLGERADKNRRRLYLFGIGWSKNARGVTNAIVWIIDDGKKHYKTRLNGIDARRQSRAR